MPKQVRVLKPITVTRSFETASWYEELELVPGIYPMNDVSFGVSKRLSACIPAIVKASAFPSSFGGNVFGDGNRDKNVGSQSSFSIDYNLDPHSFWDRETVRHSGAVVIEDVED